MVRLWPRTHPHSANESGHMILYTAVLNGCSHFLTRHILRQSLTITAAVIILYDVAPVMLFILKNKVVTEHHCNDA